MEMKELIRQLKRIDEDLTEDTIEDTIEPQQAPEMKTELVDGMSIADKLIMNKVIRSWKWYGRFTVAISEWWWIKVRKAKIKA